MRIEILSRGCSKCETLELMVREIVDELKISADITKVTDINRILDYGVIMTPGLVVDGEVKFAGYLPTLSAIKDFLLSM